MLRIIAILFVISIFIPVEFYTMLGSVRIETYRIVLGLALLYVLFNFRQALQRADLLDILLIAVTALVFASFWHNHGLQKAVESTGIFAIESLGAFYLARLFVNSPQRFYWINQRFITVLALLTVVALYEAFAQHRVLHDIAERITGHQALDPRLYTHYYIRAGIMRATSLFAHPILYGTLMAMFFPFAILLAWRYRRLGQWANVGALVTSMILTLSSAPLLAVIFQALTGVLVKFWHNARQFWMSVFFGGLATALLIEAFSNRGFFGILISYLTFNPNTGYFRILQWQYTADDIADNLILGIAHHDWTRPYWMEWMGSSIDSFWLLLILQHGLFALLLLLLACLYAVFNTLNLAHQHCEQYRWMVTAWILSFMSLILIGFTVDYFGKLQPLFFFMLGAIGWARYYPLWNLQAEELASAEGFANTGTNDDNSNNGTK
ncbi:O-antigen ligase family protein [Thiothrix nivea]|uniref:O-antigen polymerase n=1 Tax=Thiothrix nivea (strain ATCC 35100 / DSM 5205 / JP2) TaxID=870187 RepID=A0A656HKL6_THINJ|nr:hypothetical protein [Thiothrix nivea]EIJ36644.1 hypothetical protein Thini_4152 [Thiothrix nivea DSM 5205]